MIRGMKKPVIAYYAAEYAIDDELPTYAGGLGVLAADYVLEAAAQGWPVVAFGAAYRHVSSSKKLTRQEAERTLHEAGFERLPERDGQPFRTRVDFGDWEVTVGAWVRRFGTARLILIDTDLPKNDELSKGITATLYDPDLVTRLLQECVMARASVAILHELGVEAERYHMNEGHMSFVPLALAANYAQAYGRMSLGQALRAVRPRLVGTKHTILPGAGDFADEATLERLFGRYLAQYGWSAHDLLAAGAKDDDPATFSTTAFMIKSAVRSSAVSQIHAAAEHAEHPQSALVPVTNGVHRPRWQLGGLSGELERLSDEELWYQHEEGRRTLVDFVNAELGTALERDRLTLVWARRFAAYKRPTLIFEDVARLQRLMNGAPGFQLIVSGNANEFDDQGMHSLDDIMAHAQTSGFNGRLVYLPHYATDVTLRLVAGADVWLNTPVRGMEACGTSGMKAALNGALQLSTRDGWVDEVDLDAMGWEVPVTSSAQGIYEALEREVLPLFTARDSDGLPHGWIGRMRAGMGIVEQGFTAAKMLENYRTRLYRL
jgi:starch phosphorylase